MAKTSVPPKPPRTKTPPSPRAEHSYSWSALFFVEIDGEEARLLTVPNERFVDLALHTGCCSLGEIAETFGRYYEFDFGGTADGMHEAIRKGFPADVKRMGGEKAK